MQPEFLILAGLTLGGAVAAMALRNLVHAALCLVLTFAGLAGIYLQLSAEFVGWVQILVYVGAVAILIVFAILLTRSGEVNGGVAGQHWLGGVVVAGLVAGVLVAALSMGPLPENAAAPAPDVTVRQIGSALMSTYVVPLEAMGVLLTAALVGGVILAMQDRPKK